jgi:hypothetical protein
MDSPYIGDGRRLARALFDGRRRLRPRPNPGPRVRSRSREGRGGYMVGDGQSAADRLDLGKALVVPRPEGDRPLCGRSGPPLGDEGSRCVPRRAASGSKRPHRASGAYPGRRCLCPPDPIRPGGWAGPRRWTDRLFRISQGQGQPLPHPPRRDEDRCSRPGAPRKGCLQGKGLPAALPPAYRPALPPFQEGGSTSLPVMRFVRTKAPFGRVPAGGPPGGESGHLPPASGPWRGGMPPANTWRFSCCYWARLENPRW